MRRLMREEEEMSAAAGCPPGHTYNPVIKKCLPGSPLSGISANMGGGADQLIANEAQMRQSKAN